MTVSAEVELPDVAVAVVDDSLRRRHQPEVVLQPQRAGGARGGLAQGVEGEVLVAHPGAVPQGQEVGRQPRPEGGLGRGDRRGVGRRVQRARVLGLLAGHVQGVLLLLLLGPGPSLAAGELPNTCAAIFSTMVARPTILWRQVGQCRTSGRALHGSHTGWPWTTTSAVSETSNEDTRFLIYT